MFFKLNSKVFKFVEIKIHVILQLNGRNQFPTRKSNLVNSPVHVETVASEYVCFPNQAVETFAGKIV